MMLRPITTEKAVKLIDVENTLVFESDRASRKEDIKKELEQRFSVKVSAVRTTIRHNKKRIYVVLDKKYVASDLAAKLGMI